MAPAVSPLASLLVEAPSGAVDGSNVTFTLSQSPLPIASLFLFQNGLFQTNGVDYTVSGTTVTFMSAPLTGATLTALYTY